MNNNNDYNNDCNISIDCIVIIYQYLNNIKQIHQCSQVNGLYYTASLQPSSYKNIICDIDINRLPTIDYIDKCKLCSIVSFNSNTNSIYNINSNNNITSTINNRYNQQKIEYILNYVLQNFTQLHELSIDRLTIQCLINTINLSYCNKLQKLSLQYKIIDPNIFQQLAYCTQLIELTLDIDDYNNIDNSCWTYVLQCNNLKLLSLYGQQFNSLTMHNSLKNMLIKHKSLEKLNISLHYADNETLALIDMLSNINILHIIELIRPDITLLKHIQKLSCDTLVIQSCKSTTLHVIDTMKVRCVSLHYSYGYGSTMLESILHFESIILDSCSFRGCNDQLQNKILSNHVKRRNVEINGKKIKDNW